MEADTLLRMADAFRNRKYRLTAHAEQEREADEISHVEMVAAFGSERIEIVEDYPEDPRGASALVLAFDDAGQPLHAVLGLTDTGIVVVVTIYRPDPARWEDWRRRV